jgi:YVTN family beta-propeller protein
MAPTRLPATVLWLALFFGLALVSVTVLGEITTYSPEAAGQEFSALRESFSGPPTSVIATIPVGLTPETPAYDSATGSLYVPNLNSNSVSVISGSTNSVVATIPVGSGPRTPVVDTRNGYLYEPNSGSNNISVISGGTNSIVTSIAVGSTPLTPAFDSENGDLYVSNYESDNVSVISGSNNTVIANVSVGSLPQIPLFDPANGDVYVPNFNSTTVAVISGSTNAVLTTITVGSNPRTPAYDPTNGDLYVPNRNSDNVAVISGATNLVIKTIETGTHPLTPTFDNATGDLWVPDFGGSEMTEISGSTNSAIGTLAVGAVPNTPSYDVMNDELYVPNGGSANVSVISGATGVVIGSVPVGTGPSTPAYDPGNGDLYVANNATNDVSVIKGGGAPAVQYPVDFQEAGLTGGTNWSVTLNGTRSFSTGRAITFSEPNGSYSFSVGTTAGYEASPLNGSLSVTGIAASVTVTFLPIYTLIFEETGLASGTNWSVTLSGSGFIDPLIPEVTTNSLTRWSDGASTVRFLVSNGTFSYSLYAAGYSSHSGNTTVSGLPTGAVSVDFTTSSSTSSGLPLLDYAIIAGAVVIVAAGLVILRSRLSKGTGDRRAGTAEAPPVAPVAESARHLAALLFTDLSNFTSISQVDEDHALKLLELHQEMLRPIFREFRGKEIKTIGDSFLVEFGSSLDAVRCALKIQRAVGEHNGSSPEEWKFQVRIGIHAGDVVHKEGDVFGDAVNLAARIVAKAGPGDVLISDVVQAQVRNRLSLVYNTVDSSSIKGLVFPISLFRITPSGDGHRETEPPISTPPYRHDH